MTATSSDRGHPTHYDYERKVWVYDDTDKPVNDSRPCAHCGRVPTPEGYDACLGRIPGATSACCGQREEIDRGWQVTWRCENCGDTSTMGIVYVDSDCPHGAVTDLTGSGDTGTVITYTEHPE